jgi:hypothetical protein
VVKDFLDLRFSLRWEEKEDEQVPLGEGAKGKHCTALIGVAPHTISNPRGAADIYQVLSYYQL